jgi:glycosyltransferase involved in cell wall biosynthesis
VSFVIAVYNGAAFLDDTLASAAAQTHRHLEIVVVDDGSTDASLALATGWADRDPRMRVIAVPHGGPQRARNIGVAAARGAFVAHLDHDDIASPDRVAVQLAWMQSHAVDVCGSCTRVFGDHSYIGWVPQHHDDILRDAVFRCAMIHPTVTMPAAIARAHPFDEQNACGGDELHIRLALDHGYRLGNAPNVLIKYRHHATQRTRVDGDAIGARRREIFRRVFRHLFPGATAEDETALMRVVARTRFTDEAERDRASIWMARLSATSDPTLARLMAERWAAVA